MGAIRSFCAGGAGATFSARRFVPAKDELVPSTDDFGGGGGGGRGGGGGGRPAAAHAFGGGGGGRRAAVGGGPGGGGGLTIVADAIPLLDGSDALVLTSILSCLVNKNKTPFLPKDVPKLQSLVLSDPLPFYNSLIASERQRFPRIDCLSD